MPFSKCRYFETDGTPLGKGCTRADCAFVHPSNPGWAKARDNNNPSQRDASSGRGSTSSSTGWGAPPASTRSAWDASSSGWGDAGSSWTEAPKAGTTKGSGWADPENSAWTDASKSKGNESSTGGAWGDAPAADSSNSGWGRGDSTNAESAESSGWGGSTGGWGASEGTEKTSEAGGEGNTGGSDGTIIDGRGQDVSEFNQSAPARNVTPRPQPNDVEMQDVPPLSATSHRSSFSMARPGSPTGTDTTISTRIRPTRYRAKEPVGPTERFNTWELTVKAVSGAVRTYGALVDAEAERDRYKRFQTSGQFSRVAAKGREMLDARRKDYEEGVLRLSKDLKRHMDALENLPEMSAKFLSFSSEVDEAQIVNYIGEIKEWIGDARPLLVTAVASAKALESKTRALSVEDGQIEDHPSPSKRRHVSPEPNSASDILSRIYRAEQTLDEIETELHLKVRTTNTDRAVDETVEMMRAARVDDPPRSDPVVGMSNKFDELENTIAREAKKTAAIMTRQQEMEQELAAQKEERQRNLQYRAQCQQQAADMQKSLDSNLALLKQMQLQMQQVLLQREAPPPFVLSATARTQIEAVARETISEEVEPIIIDFRLAVEGQISGQHGQFCQDLWQKLEPSLQLTKQIYNWLESQLQKQVA